MLLLSPLNVYEIAGIRDAADDREFGSRRSGAEKMLDWMDGWVVDPEVLHLQLLGCDVSGYRFDKFEEALRRLSVAKSYSDVQDVQQLVRMDWARAHRNASYGCFTQKMTVAVSGYQTACEMLKIELPDRRKQKTIDFVFTELNLRDTAIGSEFQRAINTLHLYETDPEFSTYVTGQPREDRRDVLGTYADVYLAILRRYILDAKIEDNDFGDLQFAICGCASYTLLTRESKWLQVGESVSAFSVRGA